MNPKQYEIQESNASIVYRPTSKVVDQANANDFLQGAQAIIGNSKTLVLDMSHVNFLSSTGLGAIVTLVRDIQQRGGKIRICTPTQAVGALFKMVRLSNIVPIDLDLNHSVKEIEKA